MVKGNPVAERKMKSIKFEEYIYTNDIRKTFPGRIFCKNTGEDFPFNDWHHDRKLVRQWKREQISKVLSQMVGNILKGLK